MRAKHLTRCVCCDRDIPPGTKIRSSRAGGWGHEWCVKNENALWRNNN